MEPSQDPAVESMIRNLAEKTGKTLAEWVEIARNSGFGKHGEMVKYLKTEQGLTHGYANLVTLEVTSKIISAPSDGEDLVSAMFSKGKEALRAYYDTIVTRLQSFGDDVELAPKKTYVSLRRRKQFGLIQPSTKTRLDLGLNLKGVEPEGKLEASGSFNSMCTHRIRIESAVDLDEALFAWLEKAYQGG